MNPIFADVTEEHTSARNKSRFSRVRETATYMCVIYGPTDNEKHIPFSDRPKSNYHPMSARRQRHTLHSKLRYSQQMFICLAIPEGDIHESVRREHALRLFLIDTLSVPQHVRANLPRETSPIPNVGHSVASIFEDPFFPR